MQSSGERGVIDASPERNSYRVALLVALACVLQISESLIPHPVPGLRLGLAGMITLVALVTLGFRYALEVAILRTLLSSFIMGTFLSPTFILSASGAVVSALVMAVALQLSRPRLRHGLSIIGVSIVGAITHNAVQILLAYALLVRHGGIFALFPWLAIGAVGTGAATGVVAAHVCRRLDAAAEAGGATTIAPLYGEEPRSRHYQPGKTAVHAAPALAKIAAVIALAVAVLVWSDLRFYSGALAALALAAAVSRTSPAYLLRRVSRLSALLLMAFLLPVLFGSGSDVLYHLGPLRITMEGIGTGAIFSLRVLILMLASLILVRTTSPDELAGATARLLSPLRVLGISETRVATVLTQSWMAIPVYWTAGLRAIRSRNLAGAASLRGLLPMLGDLVADLYLHLEPEPVPLKREASGSGGFQTDTTAGEAAGTVRKRGGGRERWNTE
jgi:heptaprenyl diphosphate synthase